MIRFILPLLLLTVAAPAAAAGPPVSRAIVEADGSRTLVHEVEVPAEPREIWKAISTPEGWVGWAVPLARMVEGEEGLLETSYNPGAAPGGPDTIRQLMLAAIPNRMLAFRAVKGPQGFGDFETFAKVVSVFELVPREKSGTLVRLTTAGYPDSEAGRRLLAFFDKGNSLSLDMLRRRFAEGPIDWSKRLQPK